MNFNPLQTYIEQEGVARSTEFLDVQPFITHRVSMLLLEECTKETVRWMKQLDTPMPDVILTVEASGIPYATYLAALTGTSLLVAKKHEFPNAETNVYASHCVSFTKGNSYMMTVRKDLLQANERVFFADDFLASGNAVSAALSLCKSAGAKLIGTSFLIEKEWQGGGARLRAGNIPYFALCRVKRLEPSCNGIVFCSS